MYSTNTTGSFCVRDTELKMQTWEQGAASTPEKSMQMGTCRAAALAYGRPTQPCLVRWEEKISQHGCLRRAE